jgi:hypothetical protein
MANPEHFAYAASQIDLDNFIDFSILQIYSANFDWPFTNMKQFKSLAAGGRWQWIVWDNDLSLGLKPWSDVTDNTLAQALDPNYTGGTDLATNGRDTILLRGLLQNPAFRAKFLSRASELLNTTLAPERVIAHIDGLASAIEPAIEFENGRWDDTATHAEWAANVEQLREFAHRRPDIMRQQLVEGLGLAGTAVLTINPTSKEMSYLLINDNKLDVFPWQAVYFQGSAVTVTAVPQPGYAFSHWIGFDEAANPITLPVNGDLTLTPVFEKIPSERPQPGDVLLSVVSDTTHQIVNIELKIVRQEGLDLRGWRLTDNDTKSANDEGSIILPHHPALATLPVGCIVRLNLSNPNQAIDDLDPNDGNITLYLGNGFLDGKTDPGFDLTAHDNLVLLAPSSTAEEKSIALLQIGQNNLPDYSDFLVDGPLISGP